MTNLSSMLRRTLSSDGERYNEIATQISNMKRDVVKKEQEKKDMEDVVEQDKLVEIRSESALKCL
jgi:nucleosome binding factor SPN SPT16 subunit